MGRKRRPHIVARLLIAVFAGVFAYSAFRLGGELLAARRERRAFEALAVQLGPAGRNPSARPTDAAGYSPGPEMTGSKLPTINTFTAGNLSKQEKNGSKLPALHTATAGNLPRPTPTVAPPDFSALVAMNADFFGWLTIDGTNIDYPVVYATDKPDYYLTHAFDGTASKSGVPYIDEGCDVRGGLYLIHGHHMKDKRMFGQLPEYANREFWQAHPIVHFNTVDAWGDYQVMAAFLARVESSDRSDGFRYYEYVDLGDPRTFDYYVAQVKAAALYDTGIDAAYGDQLLVLSTCNYHTANGRFVVVAKRIQQT